MRQVKFDNTKNAYDSDDIKYAFEYNELNDRLNDIDVIVAEICGANDVDDWYWILQMKDTTFSCASGWCDYTGWDCQSCAWIEDGFATPEEAIKNLKISEHDNRKNIKEQLLKQIKEEQPFATYIALNE